MKKLVVDTNKLSPALKKLKLAINNNSVLPVLKSLLVKATLNEVVLIASDLEITLHYKLECECKEPFETLVPFDFLNRIVALNKNCPLTIESGKTLKISGPNDNYEVKLGEKVTDFAKLQELPWGFEFQLEGEILNCLHTAMATTNANIENRPQLGFVLLELQKDKITVASSDGGFTVFTKQFHFPADIENKSELLLSQKVIGALSGCDKVTVTFEEKCIGFQSGNITIVNTRSERKFVDYRKVFPPEWPANLTMSRSDLLEALGKCSISSDLSRTTLLDFTTKGEIKMLADDSVIKINVSVEGNYDGPVEKTQVNSDKLIKLLHQVDYDEIDFAIHDKNRAIVLSSKDDKGYQAMIMPIALAN